LTKIDNAGIMGKYIINSEIFKNKEEITERCRQIIDKNKDKKKVGKKDLAFLMDLLSYHPNKDEKLKDIKRVYVGMDLNGVHLCFWIEDKKGFSDDISFHACIKHIPFSENKKMDLKMPFGKYKGQSIYDINDPSYLEWLYNADFIDRGLKTKIGQFLRFGHIPFNPIAYKFDKQKIAARKKTTEAEAPAVETPMVEFKKVEVPMMENTMVETTMVEAQKLEPKIVEPTRGKFKNYISDFIKKLKELRTKEI
jgi:uncharacterized protein (DUF3820 family)